MFGTSNFAISRTSAPTFRSFSRVYFSENLERVHVRKFGNLTFSDDSIAISTSSDPKIREKNSVISPGPLRKKKEREAF